MAWNSTVSRTTVQTFMLVANNSDPTMWMSRQNSNSFRQFMTLASENSFNLTRLLNSELLHLSDFILTSPRSHVFGPCSHWSFFFLHSSGSRNIQLFSTKAKCNFWTRNHTQSLLKWKQDKASHCRSLLWQLCQDRSGEGCVRLAKQTTRDGRNSTKAAGGGVTCQTLQKEANVSEKGYYWYFWQIYRAIRETDYQSVHHSLQLDV